MDSLEFTPKSLEILECLKKMPQNQLLSYPKSKFSCSWCCASDILSLRPGMHEESPGKWYDRLPNSNGFLFTNFSEALKSWWSSKKTSFGTGSVWSWKRPRKKGTLLSGHISTLQQIILFIPKTRAYGERIGGGCNKYLNISWNFHLFSVGKTNDFQFDMRILFQMGWFKRPYQRSENFCQSFSQAIHFFPQPVHLPRNVQYLQQIQHNEVTQNWKKPEIRVDGSEIPSCTCGMWKKQNPSLAINSDFPLPLKWLFKMSSNNRKKKPGKKNHLGCAISDESWSEQRVAQLLAVGWWAAQPGKIQHCLKPQIRSLGNFVCSFVETCWEICSGFHGLILCRFCTGIEEFQCAALFLEQAYHPFVLPGISKGTTCVWGDDKFAEIVFQTKLLGRCLSIAWRKPSIAYERPWMSLRCRKRASSLLDC